MRFTGPEATIIAALLAVLLTAAITFFVWIVKKISLHDIALAVILRELNPPDQMSLRELVTRAIGDQQT